MYEHYDEKLKMKDVAKHFFVSEEHFSRMFKNLSWIKFHLFFNEIQAS